MRITESRLRRIIREELLREAAPGIVSDPLGRVGREEFLAGVEELAREFPEMSPGAIVADALLYFSEDDGGGRGVDEDIEAEGLELAEELLGPATLEIMIDRTSEAKVSPSALDQFVLHSQDGGSGGRRSSQRALESLIKGAAESLRSATYKGTETWKAPDGETTETFMTFEGPKMELDRLQAAVGGAMDRNVSKFLKFNFV